MSLSLNSLRCGVVPHLFFLPHSLKQAYKVLHPGAQRRTSRSRQRLVPLRLSEEDVGPSDLDFHPDGFGLMHHKPGVALSPFDHFILSPHMPLGPGTNFTAILCALGLWVLPWSMAPIFLSCLEPEVPNFAPEELVHSSHLLSYFLIPDPFPHF